MSNAVPNQKIVEIVERLFAFAGIISLLNDPIVKKILGEPEESEERLKCFLNAIRKQLNLRPIEFVKILDRSNVSKQYEDKKTLMDIKAQDCEGRWYNIEIQLAKHPHFINRMVYYGAQLYSSQLTKGDDYEQLCQTICIVLTDFVLFNPADKVFRVFQLRESEPPHGILSDHLQYYFIQFPQNPTDDIQGLDIDLAIWIKLFNFPRTSKEEMVRIMSSNSTIAKTGALMVDYMEQNRDILEAIERKRRDTVAREEYVWDTGYNAGKEEGREEGSRNTQIEMITRILSSHLGYGLPDKYRLQIQSVSDISLLKEMVLDLVEAETVEQIEAVLAKYGK